MATVAKASYTYLPPELRETILSQCTRGTLAALSLTSKGIAIDAEAMLYETISLHGSREEELLCCLRTLADSTTSRKAQLIQTFAVTFADSDSIPIAIRSVRDALRNMASLKVLSIWGPDEFDTEVEEVILCHIPNIRRVYLSNLKDFGQMLESRPSLEVVGLWFNSDNETDTDSEAELRLRRPLALHRQSRKPPLPPSSDIPQSSSGTNSLEAHPMPNPMVISIEHRGHYYGDTTLRTVTVYDCPRASNPTFAVPSFIEFAAKNVEAYNQIRQDLLLEFSQDDDLDITNAVRVVLCDLSSQSLMWAQCIILPMLEKYPSQRDPLVEKPMVQLAIIEPPKRPFNLVRTCGVRLGATGSMGSVLTNLEQQNPLREPFKRFVDDLLDQEVDELEVNEYFNPLGWDESREDHDVSEEESAEMAKAFTPILRESLAAIQGKGTACFRFQMFEEECNFPFS